MDALASTLAASPELFPFSLDLGSGTATLLRLSRADYEQSSFLDGRIGELRRPSRALPFVQLREAVAAAAAALPENALFVFHIGHVGSTLLSRLLGRHPALLSVREPDILRTLAQSPAAAAGYLPTFIKLWSRSWEPGARAVVKASSFTSDLAVQILARDYLPKAIFMGVPPETYLATILGGVNAPMEARALAPFRLARLRERFGCAWRLEEMSQGEIIALSWACEASALAAAHAQFASRVHVMNFDDFLARPQQSLAASFAHFGIAVDENEITHLLAGPEMCRYSKAPEYAYDAALRLSVLNEGRARFGAEIRRGLSWLDRAGNEYAQIANARSLFGDR
jgi:hypothetical protein